MSNAPIEARRLSGVDLGKTVNLAGHRGRLVAIVNDADVPEVSIAIPNGSRRRWFYLAPTDVVTLTGTTPSEEGS